MRDARERAVFGHFLHWLPSQTEYEALTLAELDAFRSVCAELNGG